MKPGLNLSIPQPCPEKWDSFTKTASGGFCSTCQKTVVDFTSMTDEAILNYFKTKSEHTCGRFRPEQLKSYAHMVPAKVNPGWMLVKAGFVGLLLLLINRQSVAQNPKPKMKIEHVEQADNYNLLGKVISQEHVINGVVKDESNFPLPGVNVVLKGTQIGTVTDAEGQFEFPQKLKEGDVLVFNFIGYKPEEFVVRKNISDVIAIQCKLDADILGEVAVDHVYTTKRGLRNWWSRVTRLF